MKSIIIYTIGVSKKSAEEFFAILVKTGIQKLLDIRLNNQSQLLGFSKGRDLEYFCIKCHNIIYEHVPQLSPTEKLLKKYQKDKDWNYYENKFIKILESRPTIEIFEQAITNNHKICLLCSEITAEKCHRRLVAEYIAQYSRNVKIIHL